MKNNLLTINHLFALLTGITLLGATFLFSGCDREDEPIPGYVEIREFTVEETDYGTHGSISHKITNARVFFTDQNDGSIHNIGTVTLPITLPIIVTGSQEITIDPVIKNGGNSFSLDIYPFYERFTQVIEIPPTEEIVVNPVTRYADNAVFTFIEGFEGTAHLFQEELDNNQNTSIEISEEDVFEGDSSGKIHLDTGNVVIVTATSQIYNFVFSEAARVYMELNYKNDVPIEFGIQAINNIGQAESIFEFIVIEREDWNKIYFNMSNIMFNRTEQNFRFILRAGIPIDNGGFTLDEADIFLDNIKIISF